MLYLWGKLRNVWDMTGERKNEEIQRKVIKRIKSMSYDISQMKMLLIPWKNLKTNLQHNLKNIFSHFAGTETNLKWHHLRKSLPVCFIHLVFVFWVTHRVPGWDHPVNRREEEFSYPSSEAGLDARALSGWAVPDPHGVAHTSAEQGLELGFSKPRVWTIKLFSTCC